MPHRCRAGTGHSAVPAPVRCTPAERRRRPPMQTFRDVLLSRRRRGTVVACGHETGLVREDHDLRSGPRAELQQDAGDGRFHGGRTDEQGAGDLRVAPSARTGIMTSRSRSVRRGLRTNLVLAETCTTARSGAGRRQQAPGSEDRVLSFGDGWMPQCGPRSERVGNAVASGRPRDTRRLTHRRTRLPSGRRTARQMTNGKQDGRVTVVREPTTDLRMGIPQRAEPTLDTNQRDARRRPLEPHRHMAGSAPWLLW